MIRREVGLAILCAMSVTCSSTNNTDMPSSERPPSTTLQTTATTLEDLEATRLWEIIHRIRQPRGSAQLSETNSYSLAIGQSIRKCMADHGFEYANVLWERLREPIEISSLNPTRRQHVAGYGIFTHVEYWYESGLYNAEANPNVAIVDQLEPDEAAIWQSTLTGTVNSEEPSCIQIATEESAWNVDLIGFQGQMTQLEREVFAQPLVKQAMHEWSACMSQAGYTYATVRDVVAELEHASVPLFSRLNALDPRASSVDEIPDDLRIVLEELVTHELEVAAADIGCRESHLNWSILEVQELLHERYLRANPSLLEYLEDAS